MRGAALVALGGCGLLLGVMSSRSMLPDGASPAEDSAMRAAPVVISAPADPAPAETVIAALPARTPGAEPAAAPPPPREEATTTIASAATPAAALPPPVVLPPRFDVVRVGARGSAVIAGRAAPGAEVVLLIDRRLEIGRARADRRGEWVILPADPFSPGAWELSLRASLAGRDTAGPDAVVVVVPDSAPGRARAREEVAPEPVAAPAAGAPAGQEADTAAPGPLAVLLPPTEAAAGPRLLQGPPARGQPAAGAAARLGMDSVEYEEGGTMRFAGTAPPGASVRVYVGDSHAGDAVADPEGRWRLSPGEQPAVGRHTLRVDQIAPAGTVAARVEFPFQRDELPADAFDNRQVVVQPGASLWRIARATYGHGTRYTVIYQANRDQIRDPNRIFPGQIFGLPEGEATPSASSRSR